MKLLFIVCAILLVYALAPLPIGYYTLLRIVVTAGAIAVLINESKNGINTWMIIFGLIGILFNPLIPVYFHDKSIWIPIDLISAILFIMKSLLTNKK